MANALTAELAHFEGIIEAGLQTFIQVGSALEAIKERELWKLGGYHSYKAYLAQRWHWSERQANRQIAAAQTATLIIEAAEAEGRDQMVPESEAQMRALGGVPDEKKPAVWDMSVARSGGKQPPAKVVDEVAEEVRPKPRRQRKTEAQRIRAEEIKAEKEAAQQNPDAPPARVAQQESEAKPSEAPEDGGSSTAPTGVAEVGNDRPALASHERKIGNIAQDPPSSPEAESRIDELAAEAKTANSPITPAVVEGGSSFVLTVLASLPAHPTNPTADDLAPLSQADVDRLIAFGRWAQMCAARWALQKKNPAAA